MTVEQDSEKYFTLVGVSEKRAVDTVVYWTFLWKFPAVELGIGAIYGMN